MCMATTAFTTWNIIQIIGTAHFERDILVVLYNRNVSFPLTVVPVQFKDCTIVNRISVHGLTF